MDRDLPSRAREIGTQMDNHITHTEEIKRKMTERHGQNAMQETSLPALKRNLRRTKRKADEMTTEATNVSQDIAGLKQTVQGLETKMAGIQTELMDMKTALHTGQTAYNFEEDLATYIYPARTPRTHDKVFTTLMQWLRENRDTRQGRGANRKWAQLQSECGFQWSTRHKDVFFKMIKSRINPAHPEVDYELPIPGNFTGRERRCLEDIRRMTIRLNELV